ncbi:uncharacterized protein SPPG_00018 [Spizellomyces punctatus DAOM BR117]|uniref:Uncharacterized protein n=1 Tax=Spizellomyces punctatus (strain DAOM BR117) TaxID=645134 RepID=A0A0L0HSE8_SPIPD|nr:uncharacterized protein SPPG_00018 [Spizellomyces punctatus DAOM BR117]KND04281.1 hypothetical protein SPPG_00018 [Spizellomyces punctatus DAOM BR117]|eukprot:XP_016612320.1 hypothetical protein SPPG_00018 [Spizellomyces punctatus DAOM BR117]
MPSSDLMEALKAFGPIDGPNASDTGPWDLDATRTSKPEAAARLQQTLAQNRPSPYTHNPQTHPPRDSRIQYYDATRTTDPEEHRKIISVVDPGRDVDTGVGARTKAVVEGAKDAARDGVEKVKNIAEEGVEKAKNIAGGVVDKAKEVWNEGRSKL